MTGLDHRDISRQLADCAGRSDVPGAAVAIYHDGKITESSCGVINVETGIETTSDTAFQIGSITKSMTATLMMQLVEADLMALDETIERFVPNILNDGSGYRAPTVRELLSHQSGHDEIMGDIDDYSDECVAHFVAGINHIGRIFSPGLTYSYSNTGYILAGYIIEQVLRRPWHHIVEGRLWSPLGLEHAFVRPESSVLHRTAVGHFHDENTGRQSVAPILYAAPCAAPAGSIPSMSAKDLLRFAVLHLRKGVTLEGRRLTTDTSIDLMQQQEVDISGPRSFAAWGLGWSLEDWTGGRVIGHDGGTIGQAGFLRLCPEQNYAHVLLTNGGDGEGLHEDMIERIFSDSVGRPIRKQTEACKLPASELENCAGDYESNGLKVAFEPSGEGLLTHLWTRGSHQSIDFDVTPVSRNQFVCDPAKVPFASEFTFLEFDDKQSPQLVRSNGGRTARRQSVSTSPA